MCPTCATPTAASWSPIPRGETLCWLAGRRAGWLVGWLAGQLASCVPSRDEGGSMRVAAVWLVKRPAALFRGLTT